MFPVSMASAADLVNLVGFATGATLYAMLLSLVLQSARAEGRAADPLWLVTAALGLTWNVGELAAFGAVRVGIPAVAPLVGAVSFSALGLLAAVVVHAVTRTLRRGAWLARAAYAAGAGATMLHLHGALTDAASSSALAFALLTLCVSAISVPLVLLTRAQPHGRRALWILALLLFAVSASHLGRSDAAHQRWLVELAGHHAATPLAFAILYHDYRFALADRFLVRALTLLALVVLALTGYWAAVALPPGPPAVGALLALWVATALVSPWLQRRLRRFVDAVLLGRPDYSRVREALAQAVAAPETDAAVLDAVTGVLAQALGTGAVTWARGPADGSAEAVALRSEVHTAAGAGYAIVVGPLGAGRRLLSDDAALVQHAAAVAGRRIDAIHLTNERVDRRLRDEELLTLAAEAEVRALRAQINPHFLFNALTTIGYLIGTSPGRALETLMQLTALLRGVLRSEGEFTTLGREIELVEHYLEIERARFEERLRVAIDVPAALRALPVPPLIVQPLVENAVKHGIATCRAGGEVAIRAWIEDGARLRVEVRNTGTPLPGAWARDETSVGLHNVERRLAAHYGEAAACTLTRDGDAATVARIHIPVGGGAWAPREIDDPVTAHPAGRR